MKTIKSIKNFTYLDLKELLNSIPDEELVGHLVQVAYLGGDAYGSAEVYPPRDQLFTWCSEQAMREIYLRAFELPIVNADAKCVMTAFNRIGTIAVANSVDFAQKWLRAEIGMPGIVETDCAGDMTDGAHGEAYVSRIVNVYTGATDLNEYNYAADAPDYTGSEYTYASFAPKSAGGTGEYGNLGQAMREASKRILYATLNSNAICGYSSTSRVVRITPPWQYAATAVEAVCAALFVASIAWVVLDALKEKKKAAK